jgi:hypothetical protein
MKLLAAIDSPNAIDNELVMFEHCVECDPDGVLFRGIESGVLHEEAQVIERPDFHGESLVDLLVSAFVRTIHVDGMSRQVIVTEMRREAAMMVEVAHHLDIGEVVRRSDLAFYGYTGSARRKAS